MKLITAPISHADCRSSDRPDKASVGVAARVALSAIRAYKVLISPLFTGSCRYWPSCADYTAEAVRQYGAVKGIWLGAKRVSRCHPFGSSGYDPVPDLSSTSPAHRGRHRV